MLESAFVIGIVVSGIRLIAPVLFAALGEMIAERSGVLNLGVEGMMVMGAFAGFIGTVLYRKYLCWISSCHYWASLNGSLDGFLKCQPEDQSTGSRPGNLALGHRTHITSLQTNVRSSNDGSKGTRGTSDLHSYSEQSFGLWPHSFPI